VPDIPTIHPVQRGQRGAAHAGLPGVSPLAIDRRPSGATKVRPPTSGGTPETPEVHPLLCSYAPICFFLDILSLTPLRWGRPLESLSCPAPLARPRPRNRACWTASATPVARAITASAPRTPTPTGSNASSFFTARSTPAKWAPLKSTSSSRTSPSRDGSPPPPRIRPSAPCFSSTGMFCKPTPGALKASYGPGDPNGCPSS
jgi:hypothetical protein